MKLLLDEMTLRFVWGSSGEYWYSRIDSQVHSSAELECADTEDLMANGFIPFLTISNEEVIRAYIKFLDNKKVSAVLEKLSGNELILFGSILMLILQSAKALMNLKINLCLIKLKIGVNLILLNTLWQNNEKIIDNYGFAAARRYLPGTY